MKFDGWRDLQLVHDWREVASGDEASVKRLMVELFLEGFF